MNGSSDSTSVPISGRLLGVDYGTKRVGYAVSTDEQTIASPLENYTRRREEDDAHHLQKLTQEYNVVGIVVGLPVHMSGEEGGKAREAREFGQWASKATELPVCYWDERFTSAIAENYLMQAELTKKKRKARMDMLAAQIMLQSFLDSSDRQQKPESM